MNYARVTNRRGESFNIPIEFPAELDPRFDFVRSDGDLAEIATRRMNIAAKAVVAADLDTGRIEEISIVEATSVPGDFIENPVIVQSNGIRRLRVRVRKIEKGA